jgi:hypothetical protein
VIGNSIGVPPSFPSLDDIKAFETSPRRKS